MRKLPILICSFILLFTLSFTQSAQAQIKDSPSLYEKLRSLFQDDALSFGALVQSQADVTWDPETDGQNTFRIPTARFKLYGNLDDNFRYTIQSDVTNSPILLDANVSYVSDRFALTAGAQKPGFSAEYLLPASATDFVDRSRVVSALAQRRDVGVKARLALTPSLLFTAGMFNGTNQNLENSNNTFYYTGRLAFTPDLGDDFLRVAVNAGRSSENGTLIGNGTLPRINGERTVYGGDIRLESGRLLLSSELLIADLEYAPGVEDEVSGYHITGGYMTGENTQLLVRYDHLQSNAEAVAIPEDLILAGLNHNFTETMSFQLNYAVNPDDSEFGNHRVLAQIQVAF